MRHKKEDRMNFTMTQLRTLAVCGMVLFAGEDAAGDIAPPPYPAPQPPGTTAQKSDSLAAMWQAYYGSVSFMDEQLGRVLHELDRLGMRDSTAIVFTTEHGYHLGEHGFWQKANLHEEVARVPLIVSASGIKPGRTSSLVELVDLYPSWTDLLGLPLPKSLHGKSLSPILRNPDAKARETALSIHNRAGGGLRSAQWHYMNYTGKGEELYDMVKDPDQYTNVVSDSKYAAILKKARVPFKARMAGAR
jgi:iduronate 2-sulfatase